MNHKLAQSGHHKLRSSGTRFAQVIDPAQLPDAITIEILRGLSVGKGNHELALELHISIRTLFRKLSVVRKMWCVGSTMEAIVVAARLDLI